MRVHRVVKLVTATIKLKEARKVIRKWYVHCNLKRHLLVLHNLSFSPTGGVSQSQPGGRSQSQPGGSQSQPGGVPVPAQGGPDPSWGGPNSGGVPIPGGSQPCDLSQHAILILPLWCPSCK